ncbi:MAG: hypothetical protein JXR36_04135 [Bacteroidales bacterium]|nr:hypothetical protein [Bacteroidales bacterium]
MEITATKDRLLLFLKDVTDYSIKTETQYLQDLKGWYVKTVLYIKDEAGVIVKEVDGQSFREIDKNSKYTALETADTVSLGRCLAKLGYGIDEMFASSDEIESVPNNNDSNNDSNTDGNTEFVHQIVTKVEKKEHEHDKDVAAKLAVKDGDIQKAAEIIVDKPIEPIHIPELEHVVVGGKEVLKRNLKIKEVKTMWEKIVGLGATEKLTIEFINELSLPFKNNTELIKFGTVQDIEAYIEFLNEKKQK